MTDTNAKIEALRKYLDRYPNNPIRAAIGGDTLAALLKAWDDVRELREKYQAYQTFHPTLYSSGAHAAADALHAAEVHILGRETP